MWFFCSMDLLASRWNSMHVVNSFTHVGPLQSCRVPGSWFHRLWLHLSSVGLCIAGTILKKILWISSSSLPRYILLFISNVAGMQVPIEWWNLQGMSVHYGNLMGAIGMIIITLHRKWFLSWLVKLISGSVVSVDLHCKIWCRFLQPRYPLQGTQASLWWIVYYESNVHALHKHSSRTVACTA